MRAVLLFLAALAAAVATTPRPLIYWDSYGYGLQALTGQIGGLGFGRPVFIAVSHSVAVSWLAAGGSAWGAIDAVRVVWLLVACAAAPLTWRLALECGLDRRAAVLAGLVVACSPALAQVTGTLLADGPAVSVFALGCLLAVRVVAAGLAPRRRAALALAAGAVMGLGIGVREPLAIGAAVLVLVLPLAPRVLRARLGACMLGAWTIAAVMPVMAAALTQPGYLATVHGWMAFMARERAVKSYGWRDAAAAGGWVLTLGPAAAVGAIWAWSRRSFGLWRRWSAIFAVAVPSLALLIWMAAYQDIAYSPRYLLSALPGAVAIPGALALEAWSRPSRTRGRLALAAILLPIVVAAPLVRARGAALEADLRDWPARLTALPRDTVVVTGQPCAAIPLVDEVARRDARSTRAAPAWQPVCPGWTWPVNLDARLARAAADGGHVAIDLRPVSWVGPEQQAARRQAARFVADHPALAATGVLTVWR